MNTLVVQATLPASLTCGSGKYKATNRHWLCLGPPQVGDLVVVDGGMVSMEVHHKFGPDVHVEVVDPGIVLSRANLTFRRGGRLLRARNSMLPVLSSKERPRPQEYQVLAKALVVVVTTSSTGTGPL